MLFKNRHNAGRQLAARLKTLSIQDGIVIGLPRGGVVVAAVVAQELHLPLDVIIPRKLGAPFNPELAIGAIAGDIVWLNQELIDAYKINSSYIALEVDQEKKEAKRRLALYRKNRPAPVFKGKTVIIIDDGIATGATMKASIQYLQQEKPKRLIVAIPVAPPDTLEKLKVPRVEIISLTTPLSFTAVGEFYEDFPQTEDPEVIALLEKNERTDPH
jgi:putative phosphoribosyl transferase